MRVASVVGMVTVHYITKGLNYENKKRIFSFKSVKTNQKKARERGRRKESKRDSLQY